MTYRPSATYPRESARHDALHLYGEASQERLIELEEELQRCGPDIVDRFYRGLSTLPRSAQFLDSLSPRELDRLKAQQLRNLLMLAAPGLTSEHHRATALAVGRVHSIVGLTADEVILAQEILHITVREYVNGVAHVEALALLSQRLIRDLAWQIESYLRLKALRYMTLQKITQLAWGANSYTDLIFEVAQTLSAHEEIAGCSFGRPDPQGEFRFESISGVTTEAYFSALERSTGSTINAMDIGPAGRAWRTAQIERCVNFATDPRMISWRPAALDAGFRSCVAIPLAKPGGRPVSVLLLHSALPGGFTSDDQINFIEQLQTLLVFATACMEGQDRITSTVQYETRRRWSELLRSDALEMHYQPVVDLRTGYVAKVEALARLRDGARLLTPGVFFPALSSDDFLELYACGLRQALAHRNSWLNAGFDLGVSVNLPSSAFDDSRYFDITQRTLSDYDCPPPMLTLEVLETDEIAPGAGLFNALGRFKALGIHLAEDDLGSGHSSLTRLRELPFDIVKIDRSIVSLADDNASDVLRFVYQLTRLGHSLSKQVIVEGVESEDLLEAICMLGVDAVQGYVFARPMPARDLERWIEQYRPFSFDGSRDSRSPLVVLAQLLLWEERLYLHLGEKSTRSRAQKEATVLRPFMDPIEMMPPGLPSWSAEAVAQKTLVDAALEHGMISAEYGLARQDLVRMLTCR